MHLALEALILAIAIAFTCIFIGKLVEFLCLGLLKQHATVGGWHVISVGVLWALFYITVRL